MIAGHCQFETARLDARGWREALPASSLVRFVVDLVQPNVTWSLPTSWQVGLSAATAPAWMAARDAQGSVLLLRSQVDGRPRGLLTLCTSNTDNEAIEIYVGYVLAESAWGQGFASEALMGFAAWCREQPSVARLVAGVAPDNTASIRVLEKRGFVRIEEGETSELLRFALCFSPSTRATNGLTK